nr:hypothetical protein CoNPh37_CDS0080 [Staphylococcus phage S-CoN_Ph37]
MVHNPFSYLYHLLTVLINNDNFFLFLNALIFSLFPPLTFNFLSSFFPK